MLRKSAASPNLALPRTILKSTWREVGRRLMKRTFNECTESAPLRSSGVLQRSNLPSTCNVSGTVLLLSVYHIRQHRQQGRGDQSPSKYSYLSRNLLDQDITALGQRANTHISHAPVSWALHFIISSCLLPPGYISRMKLVQDFLYKTCLALFTFFFIQLQMKVLLQGSFMVEHKLFIT